MITERPWVYKTEQDRIRAILILAIINQGITDRYAIYEALESRLRVQRIEKPNRLGKESEANGLRIQRSLPFVISTTQLPHFSSDDLNGLDSVSECDPDWGLDYMFINFKSSQTGVSNFKRSDTYKGHIQRGLNLVVVNSRAEREDSEVVSDILQELDQFVPGIQEKYSLLTNK
jgi:hypothetical protein